MVYKNCKLYTDLQKLYSKINNQHNYLNKNINNYADNIQNPEIFIIDDLSDIIISNHDNYDNNYTSKKNMYVVL